VILYILGKYIQIDDSVLVISYNHAIYF